MLQWYNYDDDDDDNELKQNEEYLSKIDVKCSPIYLPLSNINNNKIY